MRMLAFGNLRVAARCKSPSCSLRKEGLDLSLSFIPKDRMTFVTEAEAGVLLAMMCAACAIFAPGKLSTWTWLSNMLGSLDKFESPTRRIGLFGVRLQFLYLSP